MSEGKEDRLEEQASMTQHHAQPVQRPLGSNWKPVSFVFWKIPIQPIPEYRPGDAIRRIHWRTSARADELMVREFEENRDEDAALLVDLWSDGKSAPEYFETVISFVATIPPSLRAAKLRPVEGLRYE